METQAQQQWTIDPMHSEIKFSVKHLMISKVSGSFGQFSANAMMQNADLTKASVTFEAEINSIQTGNEQRDGHLKSADFFDAENFPSLSFTSSEITQKNDETYTMKGILKIKAVEKEVSLEVVKNGTMVDFYGNTKMGLEIRGKINRKEFGLNWSATTEAGGIVVSDEVKLEIEIQMMEVK